MAILMSTKWTAEKIWQTLKKYRNLPQKNDKRKLEEQLFREYAETRDSKLRELLIEMHRPLAIFWAKKFSHRGIPLEDLKGVGYIGLMNAVDRFDPNFGTKFSSFAFITITGEIRRHFRDTGWVLKIPRRAQELYLFILKVQDRLSQEFNRQPTPEEIARYLGITIDDAIEAISMVNAYETVSLNRVSNADDGIDMTTLEDMLGKFDSGIAKVENYIDLKQSFNCLSLKDKLVIYCLYFRGMTQREVGRLLRISQMQVSQIHTKALKKLREHYLLNPFS